MNSAMSERNVYYFLVHFRTPSFLWSTMFVFNLILIAMVIIIKKACYSSYLFNIYVTSQKKSMNRVFITELRIHQSNDTKHNSSTAVNVA